MKEVEVGERGGAREGGAREGGREVAIERKGGRG